MTTFIALYRGHSINAAKMVAVCTDPELVKYVATRMLDNEESDSDDVLDAVVKGRRQGLRLLSHNPEDQT